MMATTKRMQKGTVAQLKKQGAPMALPKAKAPSMPKAKQMGKGKC